MEPFYDPIDEANERLRDVLAQLKKARQIHKAFTAISKELSLGSGQDVFLAIVRDAARALFPQSYYLVQLIDPQTLNTIASESHGPLKKGEADKVHLSRSAVIKTKLDPEIAHSGRVEICDQVPALFAGSRHAIHVPLVAENQLYGAIQLEASPEMPLGDDDELLLISLANQVAMALRNRRLLDESTYLKDYLASILEHANALILVTDKNRRIQVFNRAMEKFLGFSKDQALGTDLFRWVPQEEQERLGVEITKTVQAVPSATGLETRMRNRDGKVVQIIFHLATLRNQREDVSSIIMVGQDITRLRALESQIIEAEKMASLGKLAAGVVHELNNPLTSISVYAEYLAKKLATGQTDASDVEKAKKIMVGAGRIQKLTRDLISYGRPSSEEPESLQFNELVAQARSFCEHTIRKHEVCVKSDLQDALPNMIGNRTQLLQLIINLITNACQAMAGGGELSLSTGLNQKGMMTFMVSDTGSGIPVKEQERIFEPFYTTKTDGEGTGLGLSIVSRIVEHHRGTARVSSGPGEGTTFEIELHLGENGHGQGKH